MTTWFKLLLVWTGTAVVMAQNPDKARELCGKARKAYLKFTVEDYREAIKLYDRAVQADSQFAAAYAGLAETWALQGYETEKAGGDAKDLYRKSLQYGLRAIEMDSSSASALRALARAYMNSEPVKFGEHAYSALMRSLELDSTDGETYYLLWLHTDNENPESPYLRRSFELDPDFFQSHYGAGQLYARLKDFERAIVHYKACIRINPNHPLPYYSLGNAYSQQQKYDLAIPEYEKTLKLQADLADAYLYLGLAYYYENRDKDAVRRLTRYLELVPATTYRTAVENILKEIR
jgi:tetratricopeptide (TPR) repeat protein